MEKRRIKQSAKRLGGTKDFQHLGSVGNVLSGWNSTFTAESAQRRSQQQYLPHRVRLSIFLERTRLGVIMDVLQIVLSVFACALYVYSTYQDTDPSWLTTTEYVLVAFFIFDYLLHFVLAEDRYFLRGFTTHPSLGLATYLVFSP